MDLRTLNRIQAHVTRAVDNHSRIVLPADMPQADRYRVQADLASIAVSLAKLMMQATIRKAQLIAKDG